MDIKISRGAKKRFSGVGGCVEHKITVPIRFVLYGELEETVNARRWFLAALAIETIQGQCCGDSSAR